MEGYDQREDNHQDNRNDSASTPALTPRQLQGERSKQDILDAVAALMSMRGYSGTSISQLAEESDLALTLFDGSFIAGQATSTTDTDRIIEQLVTAVHTLACRLRDDRD